MNYLNRFMNYIRNFLKLVCKSLKISKKMLFARDFNEFVIPHYKFNIITRKFEKDDSVLSQY